MQHTKHWSGRVALRATRVGKGVFALRAFRKGQVIGQMRGRIIIGHDYGSNYCVNLGARGSLEPQTPFRYINHSCEPNCELVEYDVDGVPQIWVHAVRSIRPSIELTIDYSWSLDAAIPCLCGTQSCRGWIVDRDELARLKQAAARASQVAESPRQSSGR